MTLGMRRRVAFADPVLIPRVSVDDGAAFNALAFFDVDDLNLGDKLRVFPILALLGRGIDRADLADDDMRGVLSKFRGRQQRNFRENRIAASDDKREQAERSCNS